MLRVKFQHAMDWAQIDSQRRDYEFQQIKKSKGAVA